MEKNKSVFLTENFESKAEILRNLETDKEVR
jgi:hypothetical protein